MCGTKIRTIGKLNSKLNLEPLEVSSHGHLKIAVPIW